MGLDFLDVTFRVEETFEIELSPQDLQGLARSNDILVGDLYELILKRLQLRDVTRHDLRLHYGLWQEIQSVLHRALDVPMDRIQLATPLEALFPRQTRREAWSALRNVCPYRVAELEYPMAVRRTGFALAVGMVLVEQFQFWQIAGIQWLWPLLGVLGLWMVSETYLKILAICAPLRTSFPSGMKSVKDLCRAAFATNYRDICESLDVTPDERCVAVWQELIGIISDALGVDPDKITFRSRLIRDLGMS